MYMRAHPELGHVVLLEDFRYEAVVLAQVQVALLAGHNPRRICALCMCAQSSRPNIISVSTLRAPALQTK